MKQVTVLMAVVFLTLIKIVILIPRKKQIVISNQLSDAGNNAGRIPVGEIRVFNIKNLITPVIHFNIIIPGWMWIE